MALYGTLLTWCSGPQHVAYVQSFVGLFKALQEYTKQHYRTGVQWNEKGVDLADALKAGDETPTPNGTSPAATPEAAGGPPPPPPPPPMPAFDNAPAAPKAQGGGDMGAIFEQLNRGESVTAGLKKVDKSQMTHKNPALRATGTVPEVQKSKEPAAKSEAARVSTAKKEGKKELDGNKWIIVSSYHVCVVLLS